jgi:hypothetical protein
VLSLDPVLTFGRAEQLNTTVHERRRRRIRAARLAARDASRVYSSSVRASIIAVGGTSTQGTSGSYRYRV